MRTIWYYCNCGKRTKGIKGKVPQCSCGEVFGRTGSHLDGINMRKTWSGQTKVEFSKTTIDKDIEERNRR